MKNTVHAAIILILLTINCCAVIASIADSNIEVNHSHFKVIYPYGQIRPHGIKKDEVRILQNNQRTIIDVSSPFGIGHAKIILVEGNWPDTIVVHLHLSGLEGFHISNGKTKLQRHHLTINLLNQKGNRLNQKYAQDQSEYYEVQLPTSLFNHETSEITISWVNFYR